MTKKPYYHNLEFPVLTEPPSETPAPGHTFLFRQNDGIWYEKPSNGLTKPLFNSGNPGEYPPIISTVTPNLVSFNANRTITLTGELFTPATTIRVNGTAIDPSNITFVSSTEIKFGYTAGNTAEFLDLVVDNGSGATTIAGAIEIVASNWLSLATDGYPFTHGNETGKDIRYNAGSTMTRNAEGISFDGVSAFNAWVKFEFLQWNRGENKQLKFIFSISHKSMLIGIGSPALDENSESNYFYQPEIQIYINHNRLIGTCGNTGNSWQGHYQNIRKSVNETAHRVEFENDGVAGSTFRLYDLPSIDKQWWDDTSSLVYEGQIDSGHTPDDPILLPFVTPRDGNRTVIAAVQISGV